MILVLIDHDRGEIDPLSLRALTAARKLGLDVEAVAIGSEGAALAGIVGEYGASPWHRAEHLRI
jgi:electron transfer flavoprotein alpha subunit